MTTPFLQGLTKAMDMMEHDLEADAKALTEKIVTVRARGKAAMTKGHQKVDTTAGRVVDVEKFVTALEGSNGGDPLDDSSNTLEKSPPDTTTPPETPVVKPEELTTNGVLVKP